METLLVLAALAVVVIIAIAELRKQSKLQAYYDELQKQSKRVEEEITQAERELAYRSDLDSLINNLNAMHKASADNKLRNAGPAKVTRANLD